MTRPSVYAQTVHVAVVSLGGFYLTHPAKGCTGSPTSCPYHPALVRWLDDHDRPAPGAYIVRGAAREMLSPWQHGRMLDVIDVTGLELITD